MKQRTRCDDWCLALAGTIGLALASLYACGGSTPSSSTPSAGSPSEGGPTDQGSPSEGGAAGQGSTSAPGACTGDADTAANTSAVVAAVDTFLAALTTEQKAAVQIARNQTNAIQWSNFPAGVVKRNGVKVADMSAAAQAAAIALAEVAAGPTGAKMFSEVRAGDEAYKAISGNTALFGNGEYYFSIHGTASTSLNWMLQIAGHHLAYNFTYGGKCTSATPLFDGVQPAKWTDANSEAHDPLAGQRDAVAALFASVGEINGVVLSGTFSDMINGPAGMGNGGANDSKYPSALTYPTTGRGANVASFSTAQKALVKSTIEAWVKNVADPISSALLAAYESDDALSQTYVGYSGAPDLSTSLSYARIDGPRVWIEFTVQEGTTGGAQGHYHTIWRDKVADYGADFVSQ